MNKIFNAKWSAEEESFGVVLVASDEKNAEEKAKKYIKEEEKFDFLEDHEYIDSFDLTVTEVTDQDVLASYFNFM